MPTLRVTTAAVKLIALVGTLLCYTQDQWTAASRADVFIDLLFDDLFNMSDMLSVRFKTVRQSAGLYLRDDLFDLNRRDDLLCLGLDVAYKTARVSNIRRHLCFKGAIADKDDH